MALQTKSTKAGAAGWSLGYAALGAILAFLFAMGLYVFGVFSPSTPPAVTQLPTAAQTETATATATSDPETDPSPAAALPTPASPTDPALAVPTFDIVRVETDGSTVVAGTSAPGSRVTILLDEVEQDVVQAENDGTFASLLTLPQTDAPRVVTLLAELDGNSAESDEQIILAPSQRTVPAEDVPANADEPVELAQTDGSQVAPQPTAPATPAEPTTDSQTAQPVAEPTQAADAAPEPAAQIATLADPAQAEPTAPAPASDNAVKPANPTEPDIVAALDQPSTPEAPQSNAEAQPQANPDPQPAAPSAAQTTQSAPASQPDSAVDANTPDPQVAALTPEATAQPTPTPATEPTPESGTTSVTVLRAGAGGVELLQPATPDQAATPSGLVLDTISYSADGDVVLRGIAQGGSVVRIYLDNVAVIDLTAKDDGRWRGELQGVTPGVYTLRLDELGDNGQVVSRLETPFQRDAAETLQPPATDPAADPPADTPLIRAVTVQAGDTLWAISRERYGDGVLYVRVFEANRDHIKNPDLIYPGQIFTIPD